MLDILKKVAVLATGGGTDCQSLIDFLAKLVNPAWEIVGIITNNPEAGVRKRAEAAGIHGYLLDFKDEKLDDALVQALDQLQPDLIVLAGWLPKIREKVLAKYEGKIINIHPGRLPETAGLYGLGVHRKVLELGLGRTAINIHYVDAEWDNGRKIATYPIDVPTLDPNNQELAVEEQLQQHVLKIEHQLLPQVVDWLMSADNVYEDEGFTTTVVVDGKKVVDKCRLTVDLAA